MIQEARNEGRSLKRRVRSERSERELHRFYEITSAKKKVILAKDGFSYRRDGLPNRRKEKESYRCTKICRARIHVDRESQFDSASRKAYRLGYFYEMGHSHGGSKKLIHFHNNLFPGPDQPAVEDCLQAVKRVSNQIPALAEMGRQNHIPHGVEEPHGSVCTRATPVVKMEIEDSQIGSGLSSSSSSSAPTSAVSMDDSLFSWLRDDDEIFGMIIALRLNAMGEGRKQKMKIAIEKLFEAKKVDGH